MKITAINDANIVQKEGTEPNSCCDVPDCNTSCIDWDLINELSK